MASAWISIRHAIWTGQDCVAIWSRPAARSERRSRVRPRAIRRRPRRGRRRLGSALLLAERVQEIGDDARHGRIYVPIDELQRFGVTAADIINRKYSDSFTELMRFQTERARRALEDALAAIPPAERSSQRVLRSQAALSLALLDEIEREGFQVLHQRIALTPIRKLWITWRTR